ncbi:class I SAM-dependent methyltransferase [Engelhardtia mirabilis]|uniref:Mg-protoporphyrin IX methyl transferase n=1 Tax=Engelhardtia mirabilis TaxID=2528011 RepID=A0A518BEV8_9BACT|nr:Mg-protoporphyrin IX methyl transferase [Planctomycetes bacterium Pla133]QDU99818.1 Mg-protoporphyrin IX methyl transferase [Planctomycetes bacterium Pla86]
MTDRRSTARDLARRALARGEPLAWFEELYAAAAVDDSVGVPWTDLEPSPELIAWLERARPEVDGRRVCVVGTGYGDDANHLAKLGASVVAFDCAPTAIARAAERFPDQDIEWLVAELRHLPERLRLGFDLVVEINTLQVLPPDLRPAAAAAIAALVAPGGRLFVAARLRLPGESEGLMPWPLLEQELGAFEAAGLHARERSVLMDGEDPPVRRIVAEFERPDPSLG